MLPLRTVATLSYMPVHTPASDRRSSGAPMTCTGPGSVEPHDIRKNARETMTVMISAFRMAELPPPNVSSGGRSRTVGHHMPACHRTRRRTAATWSSDGEGSGSRSMRGVVNDADRGDRGDDQTEVFVHAEAEGGV